jgi:AcrR family transcriptional regulator
VPRTDDLSDRIKRAALHQFAEVGYGSALVDDIAHTAGVGVASLYRRWPDKAALANELMSEHLDALAQVCEPIDGGTPKKCFLLMWRRLWDMVNGDPERFFFGEAHAHAGFVSEENAARKAEVYELATTTLSGLAPKTDPDLIGTLLLGTLTAISRSGLDADPDDLGNRLWAAVRM